MRFRILSMFVAREPDVVAGAAAPRRRTVLVIDDDDASRYLVRRWLPGDMFEVIEQAAAWWTSCRKPSPRSAAASALRAAVARAIQPVNT